MFDLVALRLGQGALMVHCEVEKLAPAGVFTASGSRLHSTKCPTP